MYSLHIKTSCAKLCPYLNFFARCNLHSIHHKSTQNIQMEHLSWQTTVSLHIFFLANLLFLLFLQTANYLCKYRILERVDVELDRCCYSEEFMTFVSWQASNNMNSLVSFFFKACKLGKCSIVLKRMMYERESQIQISCLQFLPLWQNRHFLRS